MPPSQFDADQFERDYRGVLDSASVDAEAELRKLLAVPVPTDVSEASVEIFLEEYGGAPSIWIYHQGRNNRVSPSTPGIFAGSSIQIAFPLSALSGLDNQHSADGSSTEALDIAAEVLKRWFTECWSRAGGSTYRVPTVLDVHDGYGSNGKTVLLSGGGG